MSRNIKQKSPVKTHAELIQSWMAKPGFKEEYEALEEEYKLLHEMLAARKRVGLTQAEVAEKMGTKAPAIARLESSHGHPKHSPSLNTLRQYAKAVGCTLEIRFKFSAKVGRSKHA